MLFRNSLTELIKNFTAKDFEIYGNITKQSKFIQEIILLSFIRYLLPPSFNLLNYLCYFSYKKSEKYEKEAWIIYAN